MCFRGAVHWKQAVFCVLALGLGLRLTAYLNDRSLWLDEAMLARNIVTRPFRDLARPLDYNQGAPVGYLAAVKTFVLIGGPSEYTLRAMSLLAAAIALGIFAALAKRYFGGINWVFACALFSISPILVYYAGEAKQYSQDVLASVLLLYLLSTLGPIATLRSVAVLGIAGAVSVWFSHSAVFVLGAMGALLVFKAIHDRHAAQFIAAAALAIIWLLSLVLLYQISLRDLSGNRALLGYWHEYFVPGSLVEALRWGWNRYWFLFLDPMNVQHGDVKYANPAGYLMGWLFAIGLASLWSTRKELAWMIAGPFLLVLIASAFRLYPFGGFRGRLMLFTVPLITMGCAAGWQTLAMTQKWFITATVAGAILLPAIRMCGYEALEKVEELRPLIQRISAEFRPGDGVYVSSGARPAFALYASDFGYLSGQALNIVNERVDVHQTDVEDRHFSTLKGTGRLWVVYSHPPKGDRDLSDEERLVVAARAYGKELESFQSPGASLRLFWFAP